METSAEAGQTQLNGWKMLALPVLEMRQYFDLYKLSKDAQVLDYVIPASREFALN